MTTSFFNGAFFGGEFFNTGTPVVTTPTITPAGRSTGGKRKRKVIIGDRLHEVDSLRDVEWLLKNVVRSEPEAVEKASARIRIVDRIDAKLDAPEAIPMAVFESDWSGLWVQLAMQDRAYAQMLERAIAKQEEDDMEAILWLH